MRGIVQGVGFRPFVYSRANERALTGRVLNNAVGVLIDLEGQASAIEEFIRELELNPPPLSTIESIERLEHLTPLHFEDFRIIDSDTSGKKVAPVSADAATCDECLREMFDPTNRRYRYPFINCTNCGPRFTITEQIPYDRANTTMRPFEMCGKCRSEYENPLDRRFHAEATACGVCGPALQLLDAGGEEVSGDPLLAVTRLIAEGHIFAIKGIGGFHLACDAVNGEAVSRLRNRKVRQDKPFALMAPTFEAIERYCELSKAEADVLESPARPIVLLKRKDGQTLSEAIAPGVRTLGFMLPYTPLHHLLFENLDSPLVMTSGNVSDEPICFRDEDAVSELNNIADYFLINDRRIHIRTDDSVVRSFQGQPVALRRARGYAPAPLRTGFKFKEEILACGAELKSTFCLGREHSAFVSHHIGDLENLETLQSFKEGIEHYRQLFDIHPTVVAYDLHPEYLSTKFALDLENIGARIGVQHHHAHIASCMADNEIDGEVIGVAFDGLGFGNDGKLWGGEFFVADFASAERVAHLANVPLAGGAKAIREPWRMASVYLQRTFGDNFSSLDLPFTRDLDGKGWKTLRSMIAAGVNCPESSSMGRLFDAISALLNVRQVITYEGQAAIELESLANVSTTSCYEFQINAKEIAAEGVIRNVVEDLLNGIPVAQVSARFHESVAQLILKVATTIREDRKLNRVALSGGVFQNMIILSRACQLLREAEFRVFTHSRVPANDGGISLGQAAIANAQVGGLS